MVKYEWAERLHEACAASSLNKKIDAQVVGEVIQKLDDQHGGVTPKLFVESSRSSKSPTHDLFEWDDSAAAEKFRLEQARYAIRHIKVVVQATNERSSSTIRAFNSVVKEDEETGRDNRVYVKAYTSMSDKAMRIQVLQDCLNQLVAWRKRWCELNEYASQFDQIDLTITAMQQSLSKR